MNTRRYLFTSMFVLTTLFILTWHNTFAIEIHQDVCALPFDTTFEHEITDLYYKTYIEFQEHGETDTWNSTSRMLVLSTGQLVFFGFLDLNGRWGVLFVGSIGKPVLFIGDNWNLHNEMLVLPDCIMVFDASPADIADYLVTMNWDVFRSYTRQYQVISH